MKPEITIANRQKSLRPPLSRLRRTLSAILERRGRTGALSVALVDDAEIRRVHREFLEDDRPTDVISFAYEVDSRQSREVDSRQSTVDSTGRRRSADFFGEIVISVETAVREARARGIKPQEELLRYAIHGLLHILGYDDQTPAERKQMRRLERQYLILACGSSSSRER